MSFKFDFAPRVRIIFDCFVVYLLAEEISGEHEDIAPKFHTDKIAVVDKASNHILKSFEWTFPSYFGKNYQIQLLQLKSKFPNCLTKLL